MSGERLLGIDLGDARIGLAIDDGAGDIRGLATMRRGATIDDDVHRLTTICAEQRATRLIVGLPLHSDGAASEQGRRTEEWAARISAALALPCEFVDERYSSQRAEERVGRLGGGARPPGPARREAHRAAIDREAARLILEDYRDPSLRLPRPVGGER
jgi:putative Holliday junction resolvase